MSPFSSRALVVRSVAVWGESLFIRPEIYLHINNYTLVCKTGNIQANPAIPASCYRSPAKAGPVNALKQLERTTTVGSLLDTYPGTQPGVYNIFMGTSDTLPDLDVPMETNPRGYSPLSDCMVIDPPEKLQDRMFDVSDL